MRTLEQHITQYAAYHRDRRNIATHFAGIPIIVFSVLLALTLVRLPFETMTLTLAVFAVSYAGCYYLKLDLGLGLAMAVYLVANYFLATSLAAEISSANVLLTALACFVAGWALQFLGHKYEGMKPAFFDDLAGLVIGPLFIMTEVFFALGLKPKLKEYVEARVGPVVARRTHQAA